MTKRRSGRTGASPPREQQKVMDDKGYISVQHAAKILGVHFTTVYRWMAKGKLEGIKIGGAKFVRKTNLARKLAEWNPEQQPEYGAWLMGLKASGECRICAIPIPLGRDTCVDCFTLDVSSEATTGGSGHTL